MITVDDVKKSLPSNLRSAVSQDLVDKLNNIDKDPTVVELVRDSFVSYNSVLREGKFSITDYLNAVTYVSFKMMNFNNQEAYVRTFPDRYASMKAAGKSEKDISSFVYAYNKNKLVNLVYEQSLIPTWILNQDAYQKAINKQVQLMATATSELVQTQAANSILTHLAKPKEAANFQLNINTEDTSGMKELRATLDELSRQQISMVQSGVGTKEIAEANLAIDAEYEEV